ncbi:type II secretion system GspH family protein [Patescibacteria group bacterium]|nr:type II secretion system GspH family protein [Patescibacteria group bacterium]MBU0777100.1 type II secretion system GspH family protein [Patescibacteria group bacterium]MBU0845794.1 type II secretion system GspH family protein [Patescibacteria group bacterium]MBU0922821.1 type II secretion system GspH family protein [Patescibacteria group bacterium]MBU1066446.1 type II secretion system GspH family protein [Patescibacteria group bacterium]
MKYYTKKKQTGFTLIELLVVVSLIGVLATLVLANLNAARQRGRDAQRKSDLRNIQTALRLYYNDYDKYPANMASNIAGCGALGESICIWGDDPFESGIQTYMSTLPDDPLPDVSYSYQQIDADNYTLTACLENASDEKGQVSVDCTTGWEYTVQP